MKDRKRFVSIEEAEAKGEKFEIIHEGEKFTDEDGVEWVDLGDIPKISVTDGLFDTEHDNYSTN